MTQGSTDNLDATVERWQPSVCEECGERIYSTGATAIRGAVYVRGLANEGVPRAWHADCKEQAKA